MKPAYLDESTHGRLSAYLRASVRDFEGATAKKWVSEYMGVFVGPDDEYQTCDVCIAGGTFAAGASTPLRALSNWQHLSYAESERASAVDAIRTGCGILAVSHFYVGSKGIEESVVNSNVLKLQSRLARIGKRIRRDYDPALERAPLSTYYWAADRLEEIGL